MELSLKKKKTRKKSEPGRLNARGRTAASTGRVRLENGRSPQGRRHTFSAKPLVARTCFTNGAKLRRRPYSERRPCGGLPERALTNLQQCFELVGVRTIRETAVLFLVQVRVSGYPRLPHLLVGGYRRRRRRPVDVHVRQVQLRLGVRRVVGGRHR